MIKKKENRKSIKKLAFEDPKGTLIKGLLFMIFLSALISYVLIIIGKVLHISLETILYDDLISLITIIFISPFILNYTKMLLMNCNDEIYDMKDLFIFNKKSFKFLWYYGVVSIIYIFITYLLGLFSIFGLILSFVLMIFLLPVFFVMPYIFLEDDYSFKDFILKSFKIVKKKRVEFYAMIISFTSWFILGIFTLGLLYLWVVPYLYISLTYLYLNFKGEKKIKKENGISNRFVIIIFVLVILFGSAFTFINVKGSFESFKNVFGIYNSDKVSNTLSYGSLKVKYYVPSDYKISSSTNTSKAYLNDDNIVQYSIYLSSVKEALEMDKEIVYEYKNSSEYKKVTDEEFNIKAKNKNVKCYKFDVTKGNGETPSTIVAYIPKDDFVLTISLISNKELSKNDIKEFIMIQ